MKLPVLIKDKIKLIKVFLSAVKNYLFKNYLKLVATAIPLTGNGGLGHCTSEKVITLESKILTINHTMANL